MFFFKWTADQGLVLGLDCRLKAGYYFGGEGGSMCKGKILTQINPWLVFDFSSDMYNLLVLVIRFG